METLLRETSRVQCRISGDSVRRPHPSGCSGNSSRKRLSGVWWQNMTANKACVVPENTTSNHERPCNMQCDGTAESVFNPLVRRFHRAEAHRRTFQPTSAGRLTHEGAREATTFLFPSPPPASTSPPFRQDMRPDHVPKADAPAIRQQRVAILMVLLLYCQFTTF
jgi:hypothetical protein